jgi:hypothetical protein
MDIGEPKWDVFLSYASEERAWVEANVYRPLLKCRTADGRRPQVFFDVSEDGLVAAQNWVFALAEAIRTSRKAVPIYSSRYFEKDMTGWELTKFIQRDPKGEHRFINPILIDEMAVAMVPSAVDHIHYYRLAMPDWFSRLCRALELRPAQDEFQLRFEPPPVADVVVNHTLPPVRVRVIAARTGAEPEAVTVRAESGQLQGSLTVGVVQGIATFEGLSFAGPLEQTRLVATAAGCDPVASNPFVVMAPTQVPLIKEAQPVPIHELIPEQGDALFFAQGGAVVVFGPERATVYDFRCRRLGESPLSGPVKAVRRKGELITVAEWGGRVHLLGSDGRTCFWDFGSAQAGFAVPGGVAIDGARAYVGFWHGSLYSLAFDEAAVLEFCHEAGVQALEASGDRRYVADLSGKLWTYQGGRPGSSYPLESAVWLLQAFDGCPVAVGDTCLYQLPADSPRVLQVRLPITAVAAVLGDVQRPVVVDSRGRGLSFDAGLVVRSRFYTAAGATPVSGDDRGRYCVFENPDGVRTLMVDGRIMLTHLDGTLAVSPDAGRFAIGDARGIRFVPPSELLPNS